MAWKIYYRGGRTFGSADGSWAEAPSEGVLVVAEEHDGKVTLHMGADHYQLDDGWVVLRDVRTILAHVGIMNMSPIKFGLYVSATQMEHAVEWARRDWGLK